jgi:hypothetical protein
LTSGYVLIPDPKELENGEDVEVEPMEETRVSVKAAGEAEVDARLGPVVQTEKQNQVVVHGE